MSLLVKKRFVNGYVPPQVVIVGRPARPQGFTATAGDKQITLSWEIGAETYKLFRSVGTNTNHQFLRELTPSNTSGTVIHLDSGLTNGTAYYYRLVAINGAGDSEYASASATPKAATTTPGALSGLGFLGDSNTNLEGYVIAARRWPTLVADALDQTYHNYGVGGAVTGDFLTSSSMANWKAGNHATYLIAFGLNDYGRSGMTPALFKQNTLNLINQVRAMGAIPVLVTPKHYDFPGHHSFNRNAALEPYVNIYLQLAVEQDVEVVNIFAKTKALNDAFNAGDTSTRTLYGRAYQKWETHLPKTGVTNPSTPADYDNVHLNDYGSYIKYEEVLRALQTAGTGNGGGEPPPPGTVPGNAVVRTFVRHNNRVTNPEAGITETDLTFSANWSYPNIDDGGTYNITGQPKPLKTAGNNTTVIRRVWVISPALTSDTVPSNILTMMQNDFNSARSQGIKLIPHPCYGFNGPWFDGMLRIYGKPRDDRKTISGAPNPNYNPPDVYRGGSLYARDLGKSNPSKARIKAHIDQIIPIFNANKDVIAWCPMSLIGYWGEGNKANFNLDYDNSTPHPDVKEICDYFQDALDDSLMMGLRYPPAANFMYGSAVTESEAYGGSRKSRVMLFDDYLTSTTMSSYTQAQTLWTGQWGEFIDGGWNENNGGGTKGVTLLEQGHFSTLQAIGGKAAQSWSAAGVFDDIERRLGPRYQLLESRIPSSAKRGEPLNLSLRIYNDGFANTVNKRHVRVCLRNKSTGAITKLLAIDDLRKGTQRFPSPKASAKTIVCTVIVPSSLSTGVHDVLIELTDPNFLNPSNNTLKYNARIASNNSSGVDVWQSASALNLVGEVTLT